MDKTTVYLQEGTGLKKLKVVIIKPNGTKKTVQFGAKGYSDFTKHKDVERKKRYESRHKGRENWEKSGISTAGFWSKWILWNKPSLAASITATSRKFGIIIKKGSPPNMSKTSKKKSPPKSKSRKPRSLKPCKSNQVRDRSTNRCRKSKSSPKSKSRKPRSLKPCKSNQVRDRSTNRCRKRKSP